MLTLGGQCIGGEGHPVFPADKSPDAPDLSLDRSQSAAVARRPDNALVEGRGVLAVLAEQRACY